MSTVTPKVFEVTAIESFPAVMGEKQKDPKVHIWKKDYIGTDVESLKFQIKHELSKGKTGVNVAAFFNRLEVKAEAVNFPG